MSPGDVFMAIDDATKQQISGLIDQHPVVLFMKGTRHFPQCGFSATVTQILNELIPEYHTVNVLKEPEIREGIKEFSSWPTIPQLYVKGKFVGGCDIVREMYLAGELQEILGVQEDVSAPTITLTEAAKGALSEAMQGEEGALRLEVSGRFEYGLAVDQPKPGDFHVDAGGVTVLIDRMSAKRADGIRIDYSSARGGGFRIDNPNEPARVKQIVPGELKELLDKSEPLQLVDVRTPEEREIARIEGARLLDEALANELTELDKNTTLIFFCHHGGRSQGAAEQFVAQGFSRVFNLAGGIDAWSREIDPSVPRY